MARERSRSTRDRRTNRPTVEALEGRVTPVTFGVPWADPTHLTLSFVPDGTPIAGHVSTLFQTLDAAAPTATWQRDLLRSFQTWAVNGNLNIGLTADGGQPLGVAGQAQHDPRFGDIRIGAHPMAPDALAVSVPNDPAVSGTMTGDVLVNSQDAFVAGKLDPFGVLLHEAGHVFGLPGSANAKSVMSEVYQGTTSLLAEDVAALQALYGTRAPDANEGSGGNDRPARATILQPAGGDTGATPLVAYGDVTTNSDVDVFGFRAPGGYAGAVTVRLQSSGVSLLSPRVTLFDAAGRTLASGQATSGFGDVVTLRLPSATPGGSYYVKVEGATRDVFGIGGYALAVAFDGRNTVTPAQLEAVLRGPYQALAPNELAALLQGNPGVLLHDDAHGNDDPGSATVLTSQPGYARNAHYEAVGSLAGPTDADLYRVKSADAPPKGQPLVLTVTVRSLSVNGTTPRVTVLSGDGSPLGVPVRVLANGDGSFSVQAVGLKAGGNILIQVGPAAAAGAAASGNYALTAHFSTAAAQLDSLATATLSAPGVTRTATLYIGRSQLMHLLLTADALAGAAAADSAVRMTIRDRTGRVVASLTAGAGDTVSGPDRFLTPGAYVVEFTSLGATGPALAFRLDGGVISDPTGPVLFDPTLAPQYLAPGLPGWYQYPGTTSPTNTSYLLTPTLIA